VVPFSSNSELDISLYHRFDIPLFHPLSALCKSITDSLIRVIDLSADASGHEDARLFPIVHGGVGHAEHEPCFGSPPVTDVLWGWGRLLFRFPVEYLPDGLLYMLG
jgi:hypothetical protein